MARRTEAQEIGDHGEQLVRLIIARAEGWLSREGQKDYGMDLEAEYGGPEFRGDIVKIQVKSQRSVEIIDDQVVVPVERRYLELASNLRIPFLLVQVDTTKEDAWYLWLQEVVMASERRGTPVGALPATSSMRVSVEDRFEAGLDGRVRDLAQFKTGEQLALSIRDSLRTAVAVRHVGGIYELAAILERFGGTFPALPFDLIIEEVTTLGNAAWGSAAGAALSKVMYELVARYGVQLTADQVERMVLREDSYSRTAINALGRLYDEHFEHAVSLSLPERFAKASDPRPRFYCRMREEYPNQKALSILNKISQHEDREMGLMVRGSDRFLDKWANRGDSAALDFVVSLGTSTE